MSQMKKTQGIFFSLVSEKKREKNGSSLLHSFTSLKEGKNSGIFDLRARNGPKKESALATVVYF